MKWLAVNYVSLLIIIVALVKKGIINLIFMLAITIVIFKFLPVPCSMVMVEREINAWLSLNFSYVSRSTWVEINAISPNMLIAAIAAEDQNFPNHWGFDFQSIESALNQNPANKKPVRGASTITQQVVKNLWLWDGRSWLRKGIEAIMTPIIEVMWSKKRILTILNIAEFGEGIFGVEEAAKHYFKKQANQLNEAEAALLAAVLPNPLVYQVKRPSNGLLIKQAWILRQMQQLGGKNFLKKYDFIAD